MAYPRLTAQAGAGETAAAIRAGTLSAREAVDAAIKRIEADNGAINAVILTDFERALETARSMDEHGPEGDQPLFGVPMTVKESFAVEGLPSCWGHRAFAEDASPRDALVVQSLRAAGAIILGKTNVPVDLTDWQSFNPVYGRTTNPHSDKRSPGGSSGGGAAAVASGMVPCEFGSDIGGSIRVPAHFCGIWGHKPSGGLIANQGHDHPLIARNKGFIAAHDDPISVAGPLARNAADLALLTRITARHPLRASGKPLKECRVLALGAHPLCPLDHSVAEPYEAALDAFGQEGVSIIRSHSLLPDLTAQHKVYLKMMNTVMARGAPSKDGKKASAADWFAMLDEQAASKARWAALFEEVDIVLAPPAPVLAIPHEDRAIFGSTLHIGGEDVPAGPSLGYAGVATFPGLPSTVLPIGSGNDRGVELPCGIQVIGPALGDLDCIDFASQIGNILHG